MRYPTECRTTGKIIWPNMFLIGVPRAGSTALYLYFQQHPQVYMTPAKEPGFLAIDSELFDLERRHTLKSTYFLTSIEAYQTLFRFQTDEAVIGDATPQYFYHKRVPLRIAHYAPEAKVVAILRSPADRMYSHYMMEARDGGRQCSFEDLVAEALRSKPANRDAARPLLQNSYYFEHLRQYFDLLDIERIKIALYDDLCASAAGLMKKLYRFLNVNETFTPDINGQPNRSGLPRSRIAHRLVMKSLDHRFMKYVHLYGPKNFGHHLETLRNRYFELYVVRKSLARETELALNNDLFSENILKHQDLIERDLSHWLY